MASTTSIREVPLFLTAYKQKNSRRAVDVRLFEKLLQICSNNFLEN
jgi:hypothetical protein